MSPLLRGALAAGALGTSALAYATLIERHWFALRQVSLPVLHTAARRPLRVLHLSDLHLPPHHTPIEEFVRDCFAQRPDLVVLTGDIVGHAGAIDRAVSLLDRLDGAIGLAVLGSNDWFGPAPKNPLRYFRPPDEYVHGTRLDTDRLVAGLDQAGWVVLENRRELIDTPAGPVDAVGLADPHLGFDRPHVLDWSAPEVPVALRLGIVHAPYLRVLDLFDRRGFDLLMAGHTHGGQVRVPGVGALVTNCDLSPKQARGASRHGEHLWLHVSAGAGQSIYAPIRFACRPEASLVDLVPAR